MITYAAEKGYVLAAKKISTNKYKFQITTHNSGTITIIQYINLKTGDTWEVIEVPFVLRNKLHTKYPTLNNLFTSLGVKPSKIQLLRKLFYQVINKLKEYPRAPVKTNNPVKRKKKSPEKPKPKPKPKRKKTSPQKPKKKYTWRPFTYKNNIKKERKQRSYIKVQPKPRNFNEIPSINIPKKQKSLTKEEKDIIKTYNLIKNTKFNNTTRDLITYNKALSLLGSSRRDSLRKIRKQYIKGIRKYHPDKCIRFSHNPKVSHACGELGKLLISAQDYIKFFRHAFGKSIKKRRKNKRRSTKKQRQHIYYY